MLTKLEIRKLQVASVQRGLCRSTLADNRGLSALPGEECKGCEIDLGAAGARMVIVCSPPLSEPGQ